MQTKIGRGLALAAIAASIAGFVPRALADDETSRVKGETIADSVSVTATVEAVDLEKRIVTLKDENGVAMAAVQPISLMRASEVHAPPGQGRRHYHFRLAALP